MSRSVQFNFFSDATDYDLFFSWKMYTLTGIVLKKMLTMSIRPIKAFALALSKD